MEINKTFVTSDKKKYTFPNPQKQDFVLRVVETRANCFQGYDEGFIKDLFSQDFSSQSDFDMVADRLLDLGVGYYFGEQYDANKQTYIEDTTASLKSMVDGFVWSFNDYKDRLSEHANEYADNVVTDMVENTKKTETSNTINTIFSRILQCVSDKKNAKKYLYNPHTDIQNMFVAPNIFASKCTFATLQEQCIIAHIISLEFEILVSLIDKSKKDIRDKIDPLEIDRELFSRVNKLHTLVLNWRNKAHTSLQTKIINFLHTRYIVMCLTQVQLSKIKS